MSITTLLAEHRRRLVLDALLEADVHRLNERIIGGYVAARLQEGTRDQLRADLLWLERAGLVRVERLPAAPHGELWLPVLLEAGAVVARGQRHPGITDRTLG